MLNFLLVSIFLIHLPPIIFFIKQISLYRIGEIIIIFLFFFNLFKYKRNNLNKKDAIVYFLFVFFFLSQSISLFVATDIKLFLDKYEVLIFLIFLLTILINYLNKKKVEKFVNFLVYCWIFQIAFELIFYILPFNSKLNIASFLHPSAAELIIFNINRGRVYFEDYIFLAVPILFLKLIEDENFIKKMAMLIFIILVFFLSLISGFRSYVILSVLGILFGIFLLIYKKAEKKYVFLLSILVPFLFFIYTSFFDKSFLLSRFFILTNQEASRTIISRIDMWKNALQIGFSYPLLGVGLGNYYLYQSGMLNQVKFSINYQLFKNATLQVFDDPHNIFVSIFSQTGFFGLFSIILLLSYFLLQDLNYVLLLTAKKNNLKNHILLKLSLMVSFWLLFLYLLFNPFNTIRSFFYFSFLRILILKLN